MNKKFFISIICGFIIFGIYLVLKPTPETKEENNHRPTPKETNENLPENESFKNNHERELFFIENPKYEILSNQFIDFLREDFPEQERKWDDYSYTMVKYLYGMMKANIDYVSPHFEPKDSAQVDQLIQDNMVAYDEMKIDDQEFIHYSSTDVMLVTLVNYSSEELQKRIIAFDLNKEKIVLDEKLRSDQSNNFINFYFNLPPIDKLLEVEKYASLHEEIIQHENISLDNSKDVEIAHSVIYYLHGMLSNDLNLISCFTKMPSSYRSQQIFEKELLQYKELDTYSIELMDVVPSQSDPEMFFKFRFKNGAQIEERIITVYTSSLINISNISD